MSCYNCGSPYHKKADCKSKSSNTKRNFTSTVECYDCHQQVVDLKDHRKICPRSKVNKSAVNNHSKDVIIDPKYVDTKDAYFILDVSGSMAGDKLNNAKEALTKLTEMLEPNDRLAIVCFDNGAFFKLRPRAVEQIRRQNELPELMGRIFAKGATALYDAIYISVEQVVDKSRNTIMTVLTDGQDNSSKHTYKEVLDLLEKFPNIKLNIIHIDNNPINLNDKYVELCKGRGDYKVINEANIVIEVTTTFQKYVVKLNTTEDVGKVIVTAVDVKVNV